MPAERDVELPARHRTCGGRGPCDESLLAYMGCVDVGGSRRRGGNDDRALAHGRLRCVTAIESCLRRYEFVIARNMRPAKGSEVPGELTLPRELSRRAPCGRSPSDSASRRPRRILTWVLAKMADRDLVWRRPDAVALVRAISNRLVSAAIASDPSMKRADAHSASLHRDVMTCDKSVVT